MARISRVWGALRRLPKIQKLSNVRSTSEFEQAFQRESALCDRSGRTLALIVCQPADASELPDIAEEFHARLRTSDVLGRLDSIRIAALLPDTDAAGAAVVVEALLSRTAARGLRCSFELYDYPHADSNGSRSSDRSHASGSGRLRAIVGDLPSDVDAEGEPIGRRETIPAHGSDRRDLADSLQTVHVKDLTPFLVQPLPLWKRALDIVVSGTLLLLLTPLFLVVALAVKLTSPGPIIFRQQRAGEGGQPFWFYKFRSMYIDADRRKAELLASNEMDGPVFKIRDDPRMTPIGRLIRRTSIDELPQLFNVLRGEMTLVGPRPPILDEVEQYEPWQRRRLFVRGGLTCIWQVSGRSEVGFTDWVRMDVRYVRNRSMLLDLDLLRRTAQAVVSGRGAY